MKPCADLSLLLPSFLARYSLVLSDLRQRGHKPLTWETRRDPLRAVELVRQGVSKSRGGLSMHCYDCAVDTVCQLHMWDCHEHGCDFYTQLELSLERYGLVSGADWDGNPATPEEFSDWPHGQGIPLRAQAAMRALGYEDASRDARDALCLKWMRPIAGQVVVCNNAATVPANGPAIPVKTA